MFWTILFTIIFTIIIVLCLTLLIVYKITKNQIDISGIGIPQKCTKDTTPTVCEPFRGNITPGEINEILQNIGSNITDDVILKIMKNTTTILGKFIVFTFSGDMSILENGIPYKLIYWKNDKQPIAIIYGNLIVFRGTQTLDDVREDLFFTEDLIDQNIMVHSGFQNIYNDIKQDILNHLPSQGDLCITGHSLGCSLSLLLAYDLAKNNRKNVYVFNTAPPKTGNVAFANYMKQYSNVFNLINLADAIPTFPFSYMTYQGVLYQYSHSGKNIVFNMLGDNLTDCHSIVTYYGFLVARENPTYFSYSNQTYI